MLEVHDELMTPGCPQCAVKHLSAALYYSAMDYAKARRTGRPSEPPSEDVLLAARAYINLGEVMLGYRSHLWFAVGLLQASEEQALWRGGAHKTAREARLMLEERGAEAVRDAMELLRVGMLFDDVDMEYAHREEARRELPANDGDYLDYVGAIERIRKEYFITEEAPVASTEDAERGGESDMATKKAAKKAPAFLKKEDPKAAKAACKGGKCKGKKCK